MLGFRRAALYSYPPSDLGFCGARIKNTAETLASYLQGKNISSAQIRKTLENFEASYPYYQLIAEANRIDDPFDDQVVEAYWLGNDLLESVRTEDLRRLILEQFVRPGLLSRKEAEKRAGLIPPGSKTHHTFHVLIIGSVTGRVKFTPKLYDLCRIGWGKVQEIKSGKLKDEENAQKVIVSYQPLMMEDDKFFLGSLTNKELVWDRRFVEGLKLGNKVSFHWGRIGQILNREEERNLAKYTLLNIEAINEQHR